MRERNCSSLAMGALETVTKADVAVAEVDDDAVVMIGDERARHAALRPRRIEHEVVDHELRPAAE